MKKAELAELGLLPSERVRRALVAGEFERALALCDNFANLYVFCDDIAKEYVLMHKGLRMAVEMLSSYVEQVFQRQQAASAARIEAAIRAGDKDGALLLIEEKREAQFRPLCGALVALRAGSYESILRHYGQEQAAACRRYLAEELGRDLAAPLEAGTASGDDLVGSTGGLSAEVAAALRAGNLDRSLRLCDGLAAEYVPSINSLAGDARAIRAHEEQVFRADQAALAGRIKEAIARGDAAEAVALIEQKRRRYGESHDLALDFMASTFSWLYTAFGDQALYDCLYRMAELQRRGLEEWKRLPIDDFARATAYLMALHADGQVAVEEDEEKFTVICAPCGSGGKMLRDGLFDSPLSRYARIGKPQPMTFGRSDFQSYCAHCAVWNNIAPVEWWGHPYWAQTPPRQASDPCLFHLYKEPRYVPAEYYRLLGKGGD